MSAAKTNTNKSSGIDPIIIVGVLFFIFGFITWLNSVLIPYLRLACELNNFQSYLVAFAFYIAYLVMAVPSSMVLKRFGFKKGMAVGLLVIGAGALIFIPAALTRTYWIFLAGLFIQGTGLTILQSASNPYITNLGPVESAAKRISIMGIFNKGAGTIAPIILGAMVLKGTDQLINKVKTMPAAEKAAELNALAAKVILPYSIIVIVLILLSIFIYNSGLPEIGDDKENDSATGTKDKRDSILQYPHLLLGVLTLFLYVGAEVLAGDTIISYGASQKIALSTAKFFTSVTLVSMIAGYIIGIICIPKYITQQKALVICAILGLVLSAVAVSTSGYTSVLFIASLGLANSLMWPAIWPLALANLGKFTKVGSSLLVMGIAGAAILPLVYGFIADHSNTTTAYMILLPIYAMILFYATIGHKLGQHKLNKKTVVVPADV